MDLTWKGTHYIQLVDQNERYEQWSITGQLGSMKSDHQTMWNEFKKYN